MKKRERAAKERKRERERDKEGRPGTGQVQTRPDQTRPGPVTDEQTNQTRPTTQYLVVLGEKHVCGS